MFYHYDLNGLLLAETSAKNKPGLDYVWLGNRPLAQLKSKLVGKKSKLKTAKIVYLHSDHLNTPRLGSDKEAEVIWRWESDAFGVSDAAVRADNEAQVNLRFPGQYFDRETGLYYNWNRYYDSEMGRYITSDPIGLAGGLNTYGYVGGNPLSWIDSLGLAYSPQGEHGISREEANNIPCGKELTPEQLVYLDALADALIAFDIANTIVSPGPDVGLIGLGIKGVIHNGRKIVEPLYKTTKQATAAAEKLGFKKIKETVHNGQAVYKKGNRYITRDLDGHNGGAWKMAKSARELGSKKSRAGTFDAGLNRIGD